MASAQLKIRRKLAVAALMATALSTGGAFGQEPVASDTEELRAALERAELTPDGVRAALPRYPSAADSARAAQFALAHVLGWQPEGPGRIRNSPEGERLLTGLILVERLRTTEDLRFLIAATAVQLLDPERVRSASDGTTSCERMRWYRATFGRYRPLSGEYRTQGALLADSVEALGRVIGRHCARPLDASRPPN
jgi:hypothetical protein